MAVGWLLVAPGVVWGQAGWSRVTLSAAGGDALDPQVAVDELGGVVVVWRRFDGEHFRVQARRRSSDGVWSSVVNVSAAGEDGLMPRVGVGAGGDAVIGWLRSDGTRVRAQVRGRSAGGVLGPVQTLSSAFYNATGSRLEWTAQGDRSSSGE